jgi:branched-chain amino acid transport system permease protein
MISGPFLLNLAINGVVEGLMIGLAALAINLVFAVGRFPNAATGDFMTIGAYAGYGAEHVGGGMAMQSMAAMAAGIGVSWLAYGLVLRKLARAPMVAAMLASIGIGCFGRGVLTFFVGQDPKFFSMHTMAAFRIGPVRLREMDLWLGGVAVLCVGVILGVLHLTSIGKQMRAVADNAVLAQASGIRSRRVMLALWSMVGAITGVGGLIVALRTTVNPDLGWNMLVPAFAAAVLGGVGSPGGAVPAGIMLGVLQELSTPWLGFTYKVAVSFVVLTAMLLLRPQGLFGVVEPVR